MRRLFKRLILIITTAFVLAIVSLNLLPLPLLSQGALGVQGAVIPLTQSEVLMESDPVSHQQSPMQMSGEMLALMGEMQQLMSTLTPEKMQEFRPYMMAHHTRMVEEMKAMLEQLQEIANDTGAG